MKQNGRRGGTDWLAVLRRPSADVVRSELSSDHRPRAIERNVTSSRSSLCRPGRRDRCDRRSTSCRSCPPVLPRQSDTAACHLLAMACTARALPPRRWSRPSVGPMKPSDGPTEGPRAALDRRVTGLRLRPVALSGRSRPARHDPWFRVEQTSRAVRIRLGAGGARPCRTKTSRRCHLPPGSRRRLAFRTGRDIRDHDHGPVFGRAAAGPEGRRHNSLSTISSQGLAPAPGVCRRHVDTIQRSFI